MKASEVHKLARRELSAYSTRSRATIITIGVLFGILIGILLIAQGIENTVLRRAKYATGGQVYLASIYDGENGNDIIQQRVQKYDGRVIASMDGQVWDADAVVAQFDSLAKAYEYYTKKDAKELGYIASDYTITELLSNQVLAYKYFREKNHDLVLPVGVTLIIVSAFILAFTMAHLINGNAKTLVLYRSIGASKWQLFRIYLVYLLWLCVRAAAFALMIGLIIAGVVTGFGWNYLTTQLANYYPGVPSFPPILVGCNLYVVGTVLCMFLAVPLAFVLCLDQFSDKKIVQKLKGA